jgi:hypothetical protein
MLRSRRFDDAVSSYERALALQRNGGGRMSPRSLANPYLNRGAALQELGESLRRLLALAAEP